MWCIICAWNRPKKLFKHREGKNNHKKYFTPSIILEHAYKLQFMSNLCQKTAKIGKKRPCGIQYVLEIAKTNFLNIERVKHNDMMYLKPSSYFGACNQVITYFKYMQTTIAIYQIWPCGFWYIMEIGKRFLKIERVKNDERKYFMQFSYFETCITYNPEYKPPE